MNVHIYQYHNTFSKLYFILFLVCTNSDALFLPSQWIRRTTKVLTANFRIGLPTTIPGTCWIIPRHTISRRIMARWKWHRRWMGKPYSKWGLCAIWFCSRPTRRLWFQRISPLAGKSRTSEMNKTGRTESEFRALKICRATVFWNWVTKSSLSKKNYL